MTYTEMIEALKYYTHHFTEQPFDPGVASMIAHKMEELMELAQDGQKLKMAIEDMNKQRGNN